MTQSSSSPEENIAQLRELALRLLARPFDPPPRLLAGSFPASLPFDVPMPDGYQIIGSFVRAPEEIPGLWSVPESPEKWKRRLLLARIGKA